MCTYVTIIRQLGNNHPVLMARIDYDTIPHDVDDDDHYVSAEADRIIADFTRKFVEFKNAIFYVDKYREDGVGTSAYSVAFDCNMKTVHQT